jgi:hypothetical protein
MTHINQGIHITHNDRRIPNVMIEWLTLLLHIREVSV